MGAVRELSTLPDASLGGQIVLLRADLNVPLAENGTLRDATRLERLLPTLDYLTARGARLGILSHFGRPNGQPRAELSLAPIARALADLCGKPIAFAEDCIGAVARDALGALAAGEICVLENTRFHGGEEANAPDFAAALAAPAALYVNDAFSAAHRAHASTHGIAKQLPAYAGPAMLAELDALARALTAPQRPLAAIIGGAKISSKLALLENLIAQTDMLIIGGGMANTFLAAKGLKLGKSLCEPAMFATARAIMDKAEAAGCQILLPQDAAVAAEFAAGQQAEIVDVNAIPQESMILDCGPQSLAEIEAALTRAETLIWNGPLGAFEIAPFDAATSAAAQLAARYTSQGKLISIAGGGDTIAALNLTGAGNHFTYISTAGGAFLEWLEGKTLPGIAVLMDRNEMSDG